MKCKSNWNGSLYLYSDDEYMECVRQYFFVEESYRDYSIFWLVELYYKFLFNFLLTDYTSWFYVLIKSGYAIQFIY